MRSSWLILALFLIGCSGDKSQSSWRRLVILPIENLAADPSVAVDAVALRLGIWDALQAQPLLHVAMTEHRRDLPALQPAAALEGYAAAGRFQLRLDGESLSCLGSLQECTSKLVTAISGKLGVTPRPSPQAATLQALAKAAIPSETPVSLEAATIADPGFAPAWLTAAGQAARDGGGPAALALLKKAPLATMSPFDAARIRLRIAELEQDRQGRAKAMIALAELSPADLEMQDRAARDATAVRDLPAAMAIYRRVTALSPAPPLLNQAAYVAAFAGDQAAAEKYAADANAAAPSDPHFLDTRGDIAFFFGQYAAASQYFEQASALNVTFMNGLDLWKAADAARRAGDKPRAESLFARYLDFQTRAGQRNTLILQAVWDWHGGDADEALRKLQTAADSMERGKALFYQSLIALNRKDLSAARQLRKQMPPNSIEAAFVSTVADGTAPPPGLPVPQEALAALNSYVNDDIVGARKYLEAAKAKMDPIGEGYWRKLDAELNGKKEVRLLPVSPDDWLSFLLR